MTDINKERDELLDSQITEQRKELKTEKMDISFSELLHMIEEKEIDISPEYQRAFRWDRERQTSFIESILLGIPFPPIFVAEKEDSVWELVDGLQRISTLLSFFGENRIPEKNNLELTKGSIIKSLEGYTIKTLPLKYKLQLKRTVFRVEIVKFDSKFNMRYELFKRLNTGGLVLSDQEIRNCIFRGSSNILNELVNELADNSTFKSLIQINEKQKEEMYLSELVLRYLSLKNLGLSFNKNIQEHMDNYMIKSAKEDFTIDISNEKVTFEKVMELLKRLSEKQENPFMLKTLKFSPSMFDTIMLTHSKYLDKLENKDADSLYELLNEIKEDSSFKENIGTNSSSKYRIERKIEAAYKVVEKQG